MKRVDLRNILSDTNRPPYLELKRFLEEQFVIGVLISMQKILNLLTSTSSRRQSSVSDTYANQRHIVDHRV